MKADKFLITPEIPIKDAICQLNQTGKRLLIVAEHRKVKGILSDGDIKRWILKNKDLSCPVCQIMNTKPVYLKEKDSHLAFAIMKEKQIEGIPIVNHENEIINILFLNEASQEKSFFSQTPVVIMAGGKGTRLYPYTKIIPKPLIPIDDVPIIERIMNHFIKYGFQEFYITVNYKKEIIKAYFNEESSYHLHFIEEEKPLGTAGSLHLLKDHINGTFFVSNCDVLVDINYAKLLIHHKINHNKITVVTAMKNYEIPYGVITLSENGLIKKLIEKPKYELFVNTGFYLLDEEILKYIPENQPFDMTQLIRCAIRNREQIGAYPVMDSTWFDMGEFSEMKKMTERLKV